MEIKKSELKKLIKEVILQEKFADMAEFKVGCESAGNGYHNVQMMIHGRVIASVKVKDNENTLYEKLFDYCKNAINKTKPVKIDEQSFSNKVYFVAGGAYYDNGKYVFKLVHPTNDIPYVYDSPRGLDLTSHHSHLYKLSPDFKSVILVQQRADGVGAPKTSRLSDSDYKGVMKRIKEKYGE